ncbi:MAG: DUF3857 domain-containing protein [Acidobacteria bacterium]|nr:MAG: DUF3857 domain-containing protein [Acidobacteriota bacterium]
MLQPRVKRSFAPRRPLLIACLALLLGGAALAQVGISTPAERVQSEAQAFTAAQGPVAKLICVYRIGRLMRLLPLEQQQGVWTKLLTGAGPGVAAPRHPLDARPGWGPRVPQPDLRVAAEAQLDPLVQAEITSREAAVALRSGRAEEAAADWKRLGTVEAWRVVGPFDNSSAGAITTAEGPEKGIDLTAKYQGKQRQVSWRVLPYSATLGSMNLGAFLSPAQSASAYAVSWVRSDKAQPVALRLRDDGATRLWVNGQLQFTEQGAHPSFGFDQHAVGAQLQAGWNEILAKVGDGETGGWSFALRITTPEGKPLELETSDVPHEVRSSVISHQSAVGSQQPAAVQVRDLTELAKAAAATPAGKLDYAWVLAQKQNFNTGDHSDTSAFLDAIAAAPDNAQAVIDFEEHDQDTSRRYQYLEQLLEQSGLGADYRGQARLDLGFIELNRGAYWPARSDFWLALNPQSADVPANGLMATDKGAIASAAAMQKAPMAAVGMLQVYADVGLRPQALAWAQALEAAGEMTVAEVAQPVGITLRRTGPFRVAEKWLQAGLNADAANLHTGLDLADLLQRSGDNDAALATVERLSRLVGPQPHLLDVEARALAGLGRGPAALARIGDAVKLAPDAPEFHVAQGEIERHFGHHAAAVAAWQEALNLNPQDASLRDRLQLARGGEAAVEASFERPYMQDLTKTIAAYKALPASQQQTLEGGPVAVLADTNVTNIFPSGNTGRYVQQIFRVNNDSGANALSVYPVTYDPDNEEVHFLSAHVVHADGSTADAPQAGDQPVSQSVGYETFYNVRNKYVVMPALRAGDFVEIAYRVLPTTLESLYGDYYGAVDSFGSSSPTLFQQYVVISPASKPLYFHAVRFAGEHTVATTGGQTVYRWSARNLPAQVSEPLATPDIERDPYVAVSEFKTWDQFGAWYRHLIRNTFVLDSQIRQTVRELIQGKTTEAEKVDAIYQWVIQNTHYVALEFGIHGYRPYPVTQVFHRRFGDCKDKASLLIAMLHEAGIEADFVLVRIRDLGLVDATIPSVADFDHAIVYVPNLNLYLDGTAEYNGTHELPAGDQRAFVLRVPVAADLGADPAPANKMAALAPVVTPELAPTTNVTERSLTGQLDAQGNLHFAMNLELAGGDAPLYRAAMEIPDRQAGALQAMLHDRLPGISVNSATVTNAHAWDKPLEIEFEGTIPNFATVNGNTLLVPRQIVPRSWLPRLAALNQRTSDLLSGPPEILVEQMHLALPAGFAARSLPPVSNRNQPFADFQAVASVNGNTLTLRSRIEIKKSLITPAEYPAYRSFWAQVDGALGRSVSLTTGGGQ